MRIRLLGLFTASGIYEAKKSQGVTMEKAKAFDGSAVIGDFIKSNLVLENLTFELTNNGKTVQSATFMLWKIDELISYVSQFSH
jgi:2-keto-4-pentenoate hydratase/2-oxohepta-3-ene-1,7-dioic acid hydratase in catechol pathway